MTDVKVMSVTFLLNVPEIVIDSVMDPTFHMTVSHNLGGSGELICLQICFLQMGQPEQLRWNRPRERPLIKVQHNQVDHEANLGRDHTTHS